MAINYAKIFNRRATPQSQPIPGSSQVRNSGGGYGIYHCTAGRVCGHIRRRSTPKAHPAQRA
jgi:hypothetical protein